MRIDTTSNKNIQLAGSTKNQSPSIHHGKLTDLNRALQSTLRKAVDRLGWSDSEVARKSGHPQSTVYRLLNARTPNPPFALVYDVCETLGVPMPFSNGEGVLTAPISQYLGTFDHPKQKARIKKEPDYVHVTPDLKHLSVGKVIDDCADRRYPKGTLLFISVEQEKLEGLKANDFVIVKIKVKKTRNYSVIPMIVLDSSHDDELIVHHLSHNKNKQHTYSFDRTTLTGFSENKRIHVTGIIQKALI